MQMRNGRDILVLGTDRPPLPKRQTEIPSLFHIATQAKKKVRGGKQVGPNEGMYADSGGSLPKKLDNGFSLNWGKGGHQKREKEEERIGREGRRSWDTR